MMEEDERWWRAGYVNVGVVVLTQHAYGRERRVEKYQQNTSHTPHQNVRRTLDVYQIHA
jgi:hypothetical protein